MGEGGDGDAGEETAHGCDKSQRAKAPEPGGGGPAAGRGGESVHGQDGQAPSWLPEEPKELKKSFRALGRQLIEAKLFTELDRDTLGRYVVAQHQWELASKAAGEALKQGNQEKADGWSRIQDRYFKQARACANDMGLTVTSRCRLVVPGAGEQEEPENQFLQLIQGGASHLA